MKSGWVRSFWWFVFFRIRTECTEIYRVSIHFQSKCGKIRTRKNSELRFFPHSVEYHCLFCAYFSHLLTNPVGFYLLKVTNRNTRTRCEILWKLVIKTPEPRLTKSSHILKQTCSFQLQACLSICDLFDRRRYAVFIVNFEHISHLVLVLVLLTFYY